MRRKMAAGNWKMNGTQADLNVLDDLNATHGSSPCDIVICPPAPLLILAVARSAKGVVAIGAQDCHPEPKGAFTGDISAGMIVDTGAGHVIVGHSERREAYGDTDAQVRAKGEAAQGAGLIAIVCIGESLAQREAGDALPVLKAQLAGSVPEASTGANLVVAYEPIWAIGTGKIPTLEQIGEVHGVLRAELVARFGDEGDAIRLLYGGSVKPGNAADIFATPEVDGALVGGASLKAEDFSPIIEALAAS
ncbi:Triosephosphate isomerase [Roseobacter fucihabitans]|uniref:Triosephosphate isomerase n=1 Tax=Roseobacter fucihabitans TaxID=1537242 RepID=A0ABZ2BUC1_9RHOB|nr:triose-phosphate isomerase [Roseobacter litoralis]MBC6966208.1 Triosephosphate isomerase [Roseobacter litoralis]